MDLPAQALHEFTVIATERPSQLTITLATKWNDRIPQAMQDDETVGIDQAALLEASRHYAPARMRLTELLAHDHDNPLLLLRRGVVNAELHELNAAEHDLRQAASVSPDSPEPWTNLAIIYQHEGRTEDAKAATDTADRLRTR